MIDKWHHIKLGEVCLKIGSGATPRGGSKIYYSDGEFSLVRSQNVYSDGFNASGLVYINEEEAHKLENVALQPHDVLLNITGDSVARCCLMVDEYLPGRVNQHVAIIRPDNSKLDNIFLRYLLITPFLQQKLLSMAASGATRNALTKGMIESIELYVPVDVTKQKALVHIIKILDDKIELNRQINGTLEEIARTLFKSWFIDFDPVRAKTNGKQPFGMDEDIAAQFPSEFEDSELGEIPKGWSICTLSGACKQIFSGGTPSTEIQEYWNGEIPWLSSGETRNKFIITTEEAITPLGVENSSTRFAFYGTTVIAGAGQGKTRGQTSFLLLDSYINQSVVALKANNAIIPDSFLFFNLERRYEELRQISDSQSSRGSLTTKLLAALKIIIPDPKIANSYDNLIRPMIKIIENNLKESLVLAELRDTLLPRLLSGELNGVDDYIRNIQAESEASTSIK